VRGLIADDGAVALQRAYRKDLVNHSFIFAQAETIHHFARLGFINRFRVGHGFYRLRKNYDFGWRSASALR